MGWVIWICFGFLICVLVAIVLVLILASIAGERERPNDD
jgi:uncharacterized membrane protein